MVSQVMGINKILYISTIRYVYPWNFINHRGKYFFIPLWLMKLEKVTRVQYIYIYIYIYIPTLSYLSLWFYKAQGGHFHTPPPPWLLQIKRVIGGLYKIIHYNVKIFIPVISQVIDVNSLCTSLWLVKLDKVTGMYKI